MFRFYLVRFAVTNCLPIKGPIDSSPGAIPKRDREACAADTTDSKIVTTLHVLTGDANAGQVAVASKQ